MGFEFTDEELREQNLGFGVCYLGGFGFWGLGFGGWGLGLGVRGVGFGDSVRGSQVLGF